MTKHRIIASLVFLIIASTNLTAQEENFNIPTLIPEIVSLGYGSYLTVSDINWIANSDWLLESNFGISLLFFDFLYITGNSLSMVSKISQNKNLTIVGRVLIAGSVVAPIVWGLFSDTADGEDRMHILLTRLIPAGFSFSFSFIR
jgi:hypothetical protein